MRSVVKVAFGVRCFEVDSRGYRPVGQRENGNRRLQGAACAQQVPRHGLGRAYRHLVGFFTEDGFQCHSLVLVVQWRRSTVRIHIADFLGLRLSLVEGHVHSSGSALAFGRGLGDVMRVCAGTVPGHFNYGCRSPGNRVFETFQHQHGASFGLDAFSGSSFLLESAWQALKPATPIGHIAASDPPVKATSISPLRIASNACPIVSAALEHADTVL